MNSISFTIGDIGAKGVSEDWNFSWGKSVYEVDFHRIYFLSNGKGEITLNNNSVFVIEPGYLYFVPAYVMKKTKTIEDMFQYYMHFKIDSLLYNTQLELSLPRAIKLTSKEMDLITSNFKNISTIAGKKDFVSRLMITNYASGIISVALKELEIYDGNILPFRPVIEYINQNYSHNITIKELALLMRYNTNYFSNKFKSAFGIPPLSFIVRERLNKSLKFLAETDLSVETIAYNCGFNSCAHYIKSFKDEFSSSPLKYRQKQGNKIRHKKKHQI